MGAEVEAKPAAVGPTCVWGTWEELILGGAVMKHGTRDWNVVASELVARVLHPHFFTPEVCKAKFEELQKRYTGSAAWFEELRKQRIAELKREVARSEDLIGSLTLKVKSLEAENQNSNQAVYNSPQTESPLPALNSDGTESVCKDITKDENSAGSFSDDTQTPTDWLYDRHNEEEKEISTKPDVLVSSKQGKELSMDKLPGAGYGQGVTVRKQRGQRKRKNCRQVVKEGSNEESNNVGSSNAVSTAKTKDCEQAVKEGTVVEGDSVRSSKGVLTVWRKNCEQAVRKRSVRDSDNVGSSRGVSTAKRKNCNQGIKEGRIEQSENVGSAKVVPIAKRKKCNQVIKEGSAEASDNVYYSNAVLDASDEVTRKSDNDNQTRVSSAVVETNNLMHIFQYITGNSTATVFNHRMDSQKRARYRMVVKQHVDMGTITSKITTESIKSTKELFRDLLLMANNALVFYSKRTREYKSAFSLRKLVMTEYKQHCQESYKEEEESYKEESYKEEEESYKEESYKEATTFPLPFSNPPAKRRSVRPRPPPQPQPQPGPVAQPLEETPCDPDTNASGSTLSKTKKATKKPEKAKLELAHTQHKNTPARHRKRGRK